MIEMVNNTFKAGSWYERHFTLRNVESYGENLQNDLSYTSGWAASVISSHISDLRSNFCKLCSEFELVKMRLIHDASTVLETTSKSMPEYC